MSEHEAIEGWSPPTDEECKEILRSVTSVAIVGVSANPTRPSNEVAKYLCEASTGYEIYFVNPTTTEVLGQPCFPSLSDLPIVPDLVDVFRRLEDVPSVAQESVDVGAQVFWTQFDLWSPEAAQIVLGDGMQLVMDRCLKVEYARLFR